MSTERDRSQDGRPEAGPSLPPRDPSDDPCRIEQEILERRIAEERAHYERGFPVAGHDFRREREDRERER